MSYSVFRQSLDHLNSEIHSNLVDRNISQFTNLLQATLSECPSLTCRKKQKPNKFPKNAWFDAECKEVKKQVKKAGKSLKKNPNSVAIREKFWMLKK